MPPGGPYGLASARFASRANDLNLGRRRALTPFLTGGAVVALFSLAAEPAFANSETAIGPGWQCHPANDLDEVVVEDDRFTLDQFRLEPASTYSKAAPVAAFGFTADIRTARKLGVTVQALALDGEGGILFATALAANSWELPSETITQLNSTLNVRGDEVESMKRVCLKVDVRLER